MHLRGQYKRFEYNESLGSTNKQKIKENDYTMKRLFFLVKVELTIKFIY